MKRILVWAPTYMAARALAQIHEKEGVEVRYTSASKAWEMDCFCGQPWHESIGFSKAPKEVRDAARSLIRKPK